MAYQLKTTGIATNCTVCLAVDPDTGTIKDFASSAVTADIIVGANVTISEQAWDGITRKYWVPGAGTADADFVKFGTNKPSWVFSTGGTQRTIVFIGEAAGPSGRVCGKDSGAYFAFANITAGGATVPGLVLGTNASGTQAALVSGDKRIFGHTLTHGSSATAWIAADTASTMTQESVTTVSPTSTYNWDWTYVNRRNDSSSHQQDKTHAILVFNTMLTEAQWDSLRDDWFTTLLETAGGGGGGNAPRAHYYQMMRQA